MVGRQHGGLSFQGGSKPEVQPVVSYFPSNLYFNNIAARSVNVSKLQEFLALYYPPSLLAITLVQGFSFDFKLCYESPHVATDYKNLSPYQN